ncbi:MAG: pentapeptide repeat-containing protein, partial [Desulfobacterales bacterium]
MSDIFISYAREDRKKIEALAKGFESKGWSVWWDRKIPPGKTFSQVIVEELAKARCVVVAWSKQSVKSNWVQEEADEGLNRGILIPVIIEDTLPPMGFRRIQAVDLIKWDPGKASQNFQLLIDYVAQILDQPPSTKTPAPQQAETEPPLSDISARPLSSKKIGQSELASILEKHARWIKSGSEEGQQADLANADLSGLDLTNADLAQADLTDANLSKADLHSANLTETILTRTNFEDSNLSNANLKDALLLETYFNGANLAGVSGLEDTNLSGADFESARGLLSTNFARSDLTRVKMPKNIGNFNTLKLIEEASKSSQKIFYALIIVGAFSWVIIAKTSDVGLFTNTSSMYLPLVGDQFLTQPLYMVVPLILISIYVFFHLYMQRNWESIGTLPAIFPDGTSLPKKLHRWFLNCFVRRNFRILKKQRSIIAKLEEESAILIGWWAVPMTLMGFWIRYLPRRDWIGTGLHLLFLFAALAAALGFYQLSVDNLNGAANRRFDFGSVWRIRKFRHGIILGIAGILMLGLSYGAINGIRSDQPDFTNIKITVPWLFLKLGYDVFADIREVDVSSRPGDFWRIENELDRINSVTGAFLKKKDLRYADMFRAFLAKAILRRSNMEGARLRKVNFQAADMRQANLQHSDLTGANLKGADLREANLMNALLVGAQFQNANLGMAQFSGADLEEVDLHDADLRCAKLVGA